MLAPLDPANLLGHTLEEAEQYRAENLAAIDERIAAERQSNDPARLAWVVDLEKARRILASITDADFWVEHRKQGALLLNVARRMPQWKS